MHSAAFHAEAAAFLQALSQQGTQTRHPAVLLLPDNLDIPDDLRTILVKQSLDGLSAGLDSVACFNVLKKHASCDDLPTVHT